MIGKLEETQSNGKKQRGFIQRDSVEAPLILEDLILSSFPLNLPNGIKTQDFDMTEKFGVTVRRKDDIFLVPVTAPPSLSRAREVEGELSVPTVGTNVPIPTQVCPAAIVKNNHRVPKVLSALERLSSVTILSLKGISKGGGRYEYLKFA
ncbi:hypothetical protein DEO72_LG7g672 [Vigna unguiculata]|uniref:Uncharacterized protein n=1 Tax=Vigna unguiculata TaxID=3917 RepID=A0A4D6MFY4_VIGUN|nr:hypothetical protein DEO72_LG7g672 [Vigna unguiculata]